jgi:hypothetical protein
MVAVGELRAWCLDANTVSLMFRLGVAVGDMSGVKWIVSSVFGPGSVVGNVSGVEWLKVSVLSRGL